MSTTEMTNSELLTEQDILNLLESEDLTPELLDLIEQYQQAQSATAATATNMETASSSSIKSPLKEVENVCNVSSNYNEGDKCAITFSYKQDMVLLPSIILNLTETTMQVLILTPITTDTIPCSAYFSQSTCKREFCPYSHGYTIPSEFVVPFEALETHDADKLLAQFQYGKRVWCKQSDTEDLWQLGNIIDQLHGPRWRVRLKDSKRRIRVDMEHIMPFKSILGDESGKDDHEDMGEWSESDRGETTDDDSAKEDDSIYPVIAGGSDDAFGSWQSHTTGFAAKMMKKMGYIQGQGLGLDGQGRLEPVEARPYAGNSLDQRPGLGHKKQQRQPRKKKPKEPSKINEQEVDMFGLMNSLLGNQPSNQEEPATTAQQRLNKSTDTRQANQTRAKLQTKLETVKIDYAHATEALRRNRGTPMEAQFRQKLKAAADSYKSLSKQMADADNQVKRAKQQKDMYTF
ncbi:hypothetical protein [Parasitella parasitica]|uniref:Zinc finger CCCH-type with G patch domain-containing protein n=1 Tax=Parasitella parasitica TaxID=35722 RepID=A0A0B7NHX1_9FUNG|nr:hypothetical protein [Parasitella parasitica]